MSKSKYIIIIIGIILIFAAFWFINDYKRGGGTKKIIDSDVEHPQIGCINYYEHCHCFGLVSEMESYPAKYNCAGYEICNEINETVCR